MSAARHARVSQAVDLAYTQVKKNGIDDIFREPIFHPSIEMEAMRADDGEIERIIKTEAKKFLMSRNLKNVGIDKPRPFFFPKDHISFRKVAWFDPIDCVKFLSLVDVFAQDIEKNRINKDLNVVHSHRILRSEDHYFDTEFGYDSFRRKSGELSKEYVGKFKLVTDISNFFDRIDIHGIERTLKDIGCDTDDISFLNSVLLHFSGLKSFGIPVGCDASRVLAEAYLIQVDKRLRSEGVIFVRYVDDFRIFANSKSEIQKHTLLLTSILHDEGLFLNSNKTYIQEIKDTEEERFFLNDSRVAAPYTKPNLEERQQIIVRHSISGKTKISKYYRKPAQESILKLKDKGKENLLNDFLDFRNDTELCMRDLVKYFLYIEHEIEIIKIILSNRSTCIYYIVDALVKDGDRLGPSVRSELFGCICEIINPTNSPAPYFLPLFRLASTKEFFNKEFLEANLSAHTFDASSIFLREKILYGGQKVDVSILRKYCREHFAILPSEIKRAIFYVTRNCTHLSSGERDALLKDMRNTSDDLFVHRL